MIKISKSNLAGHWQPCLVRDCGDYVILDSECWRRMRIRGLGDTVHAALAALGITSILGPCAGCAKRQAFLNRLAPYKH